MYYTFNKDSLLFEHSSKLKEYKILNISFLILLLISLMSLTSLQNNISKLEGQLKEKERIIEIMRTPIREDYYLEDLKNNLFLIFSSAEKEEFKSKEERFNKLALKYKDKLSKAHIPATLVWYIGFKESRYDYKAKNPNSTATGMFGFIDETWDTMCKRKGVPVKDKYNEEKQVEILIEYLNYQYGINNNWHTVMKKYHGGSLQYQFNFLIK